MATTSCPEQSFEKSCILLVANFLDEKCEESRAFEFQVTIFKSACIKGVTNVVEVLGVVQEVEEGAPAATAAGCRERAGATARPTPRTTSGSCRRGRGEAQAPPTGLEKRTLWPTCRAGGPTTSAQSHFLNDSALSKAEPIIMSACSSVM